MLRRCLSRLRRISMLVTAIVRDNPRSSRISVPPVVMSGPNDELFE
jgi:hypothetical protein